MITESLFFCGAKKFKSIPDLPAISSHAGNNQISIPKAIYYSFRATFKPSFITDITSVYDIKLNSIGAYESQIGTNQKKYLESLILPSAGNKITTTVNNKNITAQNEFATLLASKLSITSIISKDQFYGSMIGVEYGEGYLSKTPLSVNNCVDLLRNGGTSYLY